MTHSLLRMSSSPLLKKASFYFKINKTFICDIKILKARGAPNLICFIDRSDAFRLQLKSAAVAFIESVSSVWNIFGGTEMAGVGLGPRSVIVVEKRVATRISPLHWSVCRGGGGPGVTSLPWVPWTTFNPWALPIFFFRHATPLFLDVAVKNCLYNLKQSKFEMRDALNESLGSRLGYFWTQKENSFTRWTSIHFCKLGYKLYIQILRRN